MDSKLIVYDTETFSYDNVAVFLDHDTKVKTNIVNDPVKLESYLNENENAIFVGFNNKGYDKYVVAATINTGDPVLVKEVNDFIIEGNQGWQYPDRDIINYKFNQSDLMDDVQTGTSLKSFEGHHGMDIEESEVDFNIDRKLTDEELESVVKYCGFDVEATDVLLDVRMNYLETKAYLGKLAGISEAEALSMTNAKLTAKFLKAERHEYDDEREYVYPDNLLREYVPKEMFDFFDRLHDKSISDDELFTSKLELTIGNCPVTVGFGGIHGALPTYREEATEYRVIVNVDVGSYYPHLMVINGYISRSIPNPQIYADMLEERMEAKRNGDKAKNSALKLVANTTYGATLNKYNDLYDPLMARSVCISGQLYLAELANHLVLECETLKIIQLNTDGIMASYDKVDEAKVKAITDEWQARTSFELETDHIEKIVQRDVSNYIEVATDDGVKIKGGVLVRGIAAAGAFNINNNMRIVSKAVLDFFVKGVPVEKTILNCDEPSEYQIIAKASSKYKEAYQLVNGERVPVQRCNRVYASKDTALGTLYKVHAERGTVAKQSGLPPHCVIDNKNILTIEYIDKEWYIKQARKHVMEFLGMNPKRSKKRIRELNKQLKELLESM